jgi:hypothetical protein
MFGKLPRYSLPQQEFPFRALAGLASRAAIGATRDVALATFIAARLAAGAIGANRISVHGRETRANGARNLLLALALPASTRGTYMKLVDSTATDDIEFISTTFASVIEVADPHLDQASRLELGRLVQRISQEQTQETLARQVVRSK